MSDHFPCLLNLVLKQQNINNPSDEQIKEFNYRITSEEKYALINQALTCIDWSLIDSSTVESGFNFLNEILLKLYDRYCPVKTLKTNTNTKPIKKNWVTNDILQKSRKILTLYKSVYKLDKSDARYVSYIDERNSFNKLKRQTKKQFYHNYVKDNCTNPKKMWNLINDQLNRNTKPSPPNYIALDNHEETDKQVIAEKFNEFFVNIGRITANSIPPSQENFHSYLSNLNPPNNTLTAFTPTTEDKISKIMKNLKNNNSFGADDLPSNLIKKTQSALSYPLTKRR